MSDRTDALRAAVGASPDSAALRLVLAEALIEDGDLGGALTEYEHLRGQGALPGREALAAATLSVTEGRADIARGLLEVARERGVVEGIAEVERRLFDLLQRRGLRQVSAVPDAEPDPVTPRFAARAAGVTFADVGGLADVKKVLHRAIVLPVQRPDLYARYGRTAGGGVLLYGPPGCGKTMLARAIAGEYGLPLLVARIEDVLDRWYGGSERNLNAAFAAAREAAPCVVFFDELDALAQSRSSTDSETCRRLADVLLQELDGADTSNDGILFLGATNAPWEVDDAVQRPGRFGRRVFAPPPDDVARRHVLDLLLRDVHADHVDTRQLASATELFSGADLQALVHLAVDRVIDEALGEGGDPPLRAQHLQWAGTQVRPTTLEWLQRARDYVEFAGASEWWIDVASYLRRRDVRRRLGGYRLCDARGLSRCRRSAGHPKASDWRPPAPGFDPTSLIRTTSDEPSSGASLKLSSGCGGRPS